MSLPTLPTGPINITLPPGMVTQTNLSPIQNCPTEPDGIEFNELSPTGPGSGHETQPQHQPPGTTPGPTLPSPVLIPSGPLLTGPSPPGREIYRETHISTDPVMLHIDDPAPGDPYVVNFTPTRVNYESTDTDSLTIDQTDPTNIKFTAIVGSSNIDDVFGNTNVFWATKYNLTTDVNGSSALSNAIVQKSHKDINYSNIGTITFKKAGFYFYSISANVQSAATVGYAKINFNPSGGSPPNMSNTNVISTTSFESTSTITNTTGIIVANNTTIAPIIKTNATYTWDRIDIIIATMYGPEIAGSGATEWAIQGAYRYQMPYNFDYDRVVNKNYFFGMYGAPYGTGLPKSGMTPPHQLILSNSYIGDSDNPFWYPNGQMYLEFTISPSPNITDVNLLDITVEAWDKTVPSDIIIRPNIFNDGIGNLCQGFVVWFPFITSSYTNTSFKLNINIPGISTNHKLYFKHCNDGQNGCTTSLPGGSYNLKRTNDGISGYPTSYGHVYYDDTKGPSFYEFHVTLYSYNSNSNGYGFTLWDDPANISFELGSGTVTIGYPDVDPRLGEYVGVNFIDPYDYANYPWMDPSDPYYDELADPKSPNYDSGYCLNNYFYGNYVLGYTPTITYVPPTDITTYPHPYPWDVTPVGHWVIKFPIVSSFPYYSALLLGYSQDWILDWYGEGPYSVQLTFGVYYKGNFITNIFMTAD